MREIESLAGALVSQLAVLENEVPQAPELHGAVGAAHVLVTVDNWNLADNRFHSRIDRGEDQGVAARIGDAPNADPVRVDVVSPLEERHCILIVADLRPRVEMLPDVAVADTQVSIVEDHCV